MTCCHFLKNGEVCGVPETSHPYMVGDHEFKSLVVEHGRGVTESRILSLESHRMAVNIRIAEFDKRIRELESKSMPSPGLKTITLQLEVKS